MSEKRRKPAGRGGRRKKCEVELSYRVQKVQEAFVVSFPAELRFLTVRVADRVTVVVPLVGELEGRAFFFPVKTEPVDAVKHACQALLGKAVEEFLKKKKA